MRGPRWPSDEMSPKKAIFFGGGEAEGRKKQNSSKVSLHTDRHCRHLWNDGTFDGRWGGGGGARGETCSRRTGSRRTIGIFFIKVTLKTSCIHTYFFFNENVPTGCVIATRPPSCLVLVPSAAQLISGKPLCDGNVPSAALPPVG